jgi:hypothetical protein
LISFRRVLSIRVNYNRSTVPASEEEHPLDFMELHFLLVFQPDGVAILADGVANLAEEEIANHG